MTTMEEKNKKLKKILKLADRSEISSLQNVISGILEIINNSEATAGDMEELIKIDPPLLVKVLKTANSALYAPKTQILGIRQAVMWIGFDALKELALSLRVSDVFKGEKTIEGYSRKRLWKHSAAVALFGRMLFRREFGEKGENAYVAGLLHDIGIIVEDQFMHDDFIEILKASNGEKTNLMVIENQRMGFDHAEIGSALLKGWNLPKELIISISCHHDPDTAKAPYTKLATTLFIADYVCQNNGIGYGDAPYPDNSVFKKCLMRLGISQQAVDLILDEVMTEISEMEERGLL
jgi:putative nucleotidyltransferase with HDIG domain